MATARRPRATSDGDADEMALLSRTEMMKTCIWPPVEFRGFTNGGGDDTGGYR